MPLYKIFLILLFNVAGFYTMDVVASMVRKRRTELPGKGESSEPRDSSAGRGATRRPPQQQQGQGATRRPPWQQQGQGAPLCPPQQQQGQGAPQRPPQQHQGQGVPRRPPQQQQPQQQQGRGAPQRPPQQLQQQVGSGYRGPGGYDGGRGGLQGGVVPQQYSGGPPEFYQQPCGLVPQSRGGGVASGACGGFVPSAGGPFRPSIPELHQAIQAPHQAGVMTQPMPHMIPAEVTQSVASPSVRADEPSSLQLTHQLQQVSLKPESSSTESVQPIPVSSKSLRFPLRPGRGSTGSRVVVKANHFLAELPDKDLHQYDVSYVDCVTAI